MSCVNRLGRCEGVCCSEKCESKSTNCPKWIPFVMEVVLGSFLVSTRCAKFTWERCARHTLILEAILHDVGVQFGSLFRLCMVEPGQNFRFPIKYLSGRCFGGFHVGPRGRFLRDFGLHALQIRLQHKLSLPFYRIRFSVINLDDTELVVSKLQSQMHTCSTTNLFLRKKRKLVEHVHLDAVRPICRSILDGVECCKWLQWTSLDSWLLYGGSLLKFREQGPTPVPVQICSLADVSRAWCCAHSSLF